MKWNKVISPVTTFQMLWTETIHPKNKITKKDKKKKMKITARTNQVAQNHVCEQFLCNFTTKHVNEDKLYGNDSCWFVGIVFSFSNEK